MKNLYKKIRGKCLTDESAKAVIDILEPYIFHAESCELKDQSVDMYLKQTDGYKVKCTCGLL